MDLGKKYERSDALEEEMPKMELVVERELTFADIASDFGWKIHNFAPYTTWKRGSSFSCGHFWDQALFNHDAPNAQLIKGHLSAVSNKWSIAFVQHCDKLEAQVKQFVHNAEQSALVIQQEGTIQAGAAVPVELAAQKRTCLTEMSPPAETAASQPPAPHSMAQSLLRPRVESLDTKQHTAAILVAGTPSEPAQPKSQDMVVASSDPIEVWTATPAQEDEPEDPIQSWAFSQTPVPDVNQQFNIDAFLDLDYEGIDQHLSGSELIPDSQGVHPEALVLFSVMPAPANDPDDPDNAQSSAELSAQTDGSSGLSTILGPTVTHKRKRSDDSDTV
jgi:hypothetical protein